VAGAAVLGSRGHGRPAVLPVPGRGGEGVQTLTLWVGAGLPPGGYNLRVVLMDDLRCRFHLQPLAVSAP
jgi:hypothetical protein